MFYFVIEELAKRVLPLPEKGRKTVTTRRPPRKVPSYHLTGAQSMKYIKEADARAKEKSTEAEKMDKVKKEAVKNAKAAERKKIQQKKGHRK